MRPSDLVPKTLGRYLIGRRIGAGGMGAVYEARHVVLDKPFAVKVLRSDMTIDPSVRRRFVNEGRLASRVRHPHIVDVTDAAEENGVAFLVMELLEGEPLTAMMTREGRIAIGRALEVVLPIAAALAEAHRQDVVHHDVKPDNILLVRSPKGRLYPKILDFGISEARGRRDDDDTIAGTPRYMAPEHALGLAADGRSDQYALAVVLFEMITGVLPYAHGETEHLFSLIHEITCGVPARLRELIPTAPIELDAVLARAMSRAPDDRYPTLDDFGRALLPFASPRGLRRFRELVDPAWTADMPAVPATPISSWPPPLARSAGRPPQRSVRYMPAVVPPEGPVSRVVPRARLARARAWLVTWIAIVVLFGLAAAFVATRGG